jgi:hypothetical protein
MSKPTMPDFPLRKTADVEEFPSAGEGLENTSNEKQQGFNRHDMIRADIAGPEDEAPADEEFLPPVDYVLTERNTFRDISEDINRLRLEIDNLRARFTIIQQQAATVVRSNVEWADASAHAQLGSYPWVKLACAMTATFVGARVLGRAAGFAAMVLPLITSPPRGR